jgi:hypothetical protein
VNSPRPVFGPRLPGAGPTQWLKWLLRPRLAGAAHQRNHRVLARCGAAAGGGGEVARMVPSLHGECRRFLGSAPGKEDGAGAHPDGVATMRRWFTVWQRRFIDGKPVRWLTAVVEGSCSTERLRGGVRHGKSDKTRAHGGTHRRRPRRRRFGQIR